MPGLITELSTILIIFAYFYRGQDPDFKSTMDNYACSMRTRKKDIWKAKNNNNHKIITLGVWSLGSRFLKYR